MTSLSRLLQSTDTATCPTSLLTNETLQNCVDWQISQSEKYNCSSDSYLSSLTPGKYAGITANYLSFNTGQATPHFKERAQMLTRCTGGEILFTEATDIAVDPINDIGSASAIGAELYDAYLMIYSFTSEASSLGLFETLNDRIREKTVQLEYEDMFPRVRNMGEYRKEAANIQLLIQLSSWVSSLSTSIRPPTSKIRTPAARATHTSSLKWSKITWFSTKTLAT